jgi:hypothetical protein
MIPSTHYYVLSLGAESTNLYEAFRDALIGVENQGFPTTPPISASATASNATRRALMRTVDECFDYYDSRERLGLVLVGDEALQSAFDSVTTHGSAIVGRVNGDRTGIRANDLGQIVWPVVKECISAVHDRAMRDLDECLREGRVVSGLDAVVAAVGGGVRGTLLVEDDFHVRGSLATGTQPPVVSEDVDIRDVIDNAVDAVIERVLAAGGNVVFMHSGALADRGRIALLLREMRQK